MRTNQAATEPKDPGVMAPDAELSPEPLEDAVLLDVLDPDEEELVSTAEDEEPASEEAVSVGGGADPVRIYLRQMGAVALLSREGEVEIAQRIEEGERATLRALLTTPYALRYVMTLGERLRAGEVRLRDLLRDEVEDDAEARGDTAEEDVPPLRGQGEARHPRGRHEIPRYSQRLAPPEAVAVEAGRQLREARQAISQTLDQSQESRAGSQGRQQGRHGGGGHLVPHVGAEARQTDAEDRGVEPPLPQTRFRAHRWLLSRSSITMLRGSQESATEARRRLFTFSF